MPFSTCKNGPCVIYCILFRTENNNVTVKNLHKDGEGTIPNPVVTFEQAFQHHRMCGSVVQYIPSIYQKYLLERISRLVDSLYIVIDCMALPAMDLSVIV